MEAGGNWEGVPEWPRKTEGGETGGTLGDTEGLWTGTGLDPWRDMGLDTPERQRQLSDLFFKINSLYTSQTLQRNSSLRSREPRAHVLVTTQKHRGHGKHANEKVCLT